MAKKVADAIMGERTATEPSYEELKAKVAALENGKPLEFRVSEKGGCSVYNLGRFPVTLYYEQWVRLLNDRGRLEDFLSANKSKFKLKEKA